MLPRSRRPVLLPTSSSNRSSPRPVETPFRNRKPSLSPALVVTSPNCSPVRNQTLRFPNLTHTPNQSPLASVSSRSRLQPLKPGIALKLQVPRRNTFTLQVPTDLSSPSKPRLVSARKPTSRSERRPDPYFSQVTAFACLSKEGRTRSVPKAHNQDAFIAVPNLAGRSDAYLFGVFDGHGAYGHDVSQFLRDHMEEYITKGMKTADLGNPELVIDAIKDGFRAAEMGVRKGTVDHTHSGSTCIVVVVIGDVCLCGNVGDSRAVLIRETGSAWIPVPLSRDQKPTVEEERARIIERGGKIAQYCSSSGVYSGPLRVWLPNQPLPGLAMTRSIGDSIASRIGVIGEPEVHQVLLTPDDQGLLLASDGLWEIMQNEEAVELVRKHVDHRPEFVVEKLMEEAQARWLSSNADDTTIMYVRLAARRPSI